MERDAERKETLKQIIRDLHRGVSVDELKGRFRELLRDVGASEITEIESQLVAEGLPEAEIRRLCDVHVALFQESLEQQMPLDRPAPAETQVAGPVDVLREENEAVSTVVEELRRLFSEAETAWAATREEFDKLAELQKHYLRLENQLFPLLEEHGVQGPPRVLWALHDDIRALLKEVDAAIEEHDRETMFEKGLKILKLVEDMIYREENILFPTALEVLDAGDWARVRAGEREIGFTIIQPPATYLKGTAEVRQEPEKEVSTGAREGLLDLHVGVLTAKQVGLLLSHLPVDITFVDEDDRVRFYTESDRIFPRSPGIIGRTVQNCHPPESVAVVERIISEFREGSRDVAEFWMEHKRRFIHIRYFAIRDGGGEYRGVLEVAQDVTDIRELDGERRLLDW